MRAKAWLWLGSFLLVALSCTRSSPTPPPQPEVPLVDRSIHSVPLEDIHFDTFDGGSIPLSQAPTTTILRLRDQIPPLHYPKYEGVEGGAWLEPQDLVVGYAVGRQAYAYPIKVLNYHEIVNEEIAGRPILVSYCPLCASGIVYDRQVEGRVLTFGNTSALYESDLVMYDHQTGSYWFQVAGRAIVGPLTGQMLTPLPGVTMPWVEWQKLHPTTRVLSRDTGYRRNYSRDPFQGYTLLVNQGQFAFPVSEKARDDRLLAGETVLAVQLKGITRAYPLKRLGDRAVNEAISGIKVVVFSLRVGPAGAAFLPRADGRELNFEFREGEFRDRETVTTWNLAGLATAGSLKGKRLQPLPSRTTLWFALAAAFPDSQVYNP